MGTWGATRRRRAQPGRAMGQANQPEAAARPRDPAAPPVSTSTVTDAAKKAEAPQPEGPEERLDRLKAIFPRVNYFPSLPKQLAWRSGVTHVATYAKNQPCEDFGSISINVAHHRTILTILDGHAGPYCAAYAQLRLPAIVNKHLDAVQSEFRRRARPKNAHPHPVDLVDEPAHRC